MNAQRIEGAVALVTGANRGIEAGQEDIFPDPFAVDFGRRFESSPKASERQIAAMISGGAA